MEEDDRLGGTGREGGIGIEEEYSNDKKCGTVWMWMSVYEQGWATRGRAADRYSGSVKRTQNFPQYPCEEWENVIGGLRSSLPEVMRRASDVCGQRRYEDQRHTRSA
jgi:hypothetical protein